MPKQKYSIHTPVLIKEVLECLEPKNGESYFDATAGFGGHAKEILKLTNAPLKTTLVDRDESAFNELKAQFAASGSRILHTDFLAASKSLRAEGAKLDMILADLGASSLHFDSRERGFAFSKPASLDMRMDQRQALTAAHIVNNWNEQDLVQLLKNYGQEPKSRAIARAITQNRPVQNTEQLANIVKSVYRVHRKIHPATRVFQALRITVNSELEQLEKSLPVWADLLAPGGRLAVISFHSLEDSLVKKFLSEYAANTYDSDLSLINKKPITPSKAEIALNPRARSAKLRACRKLKQK